MLVTGVLFLCLVSSEGARILGIFPTPSISHQLPFQVVMRALALKGHQVTVISPNPLKSPVPNYTEIDMSSTYTYWRETFQFLTIEQISPVSSMPMFVNAMVDITDLQLGSPQIQSIIKSNDIKFDLVIIEQLMYQAYHGLIHHVGSPPMVGILSLGALSSSFVAQGNPNNPSYCPDILSPYSNHMNFWDRMYNAYVMARFMFDWHVNLLPKQERLLRKYFGSSPPSVYVSEYNTSLLLVNNHWSLNYPRPLMPNIVEVTGLHLQLTPGTLPKNIQHFLDEAPEGVIYFSLGSNVRSDEMPEKKRQEILQVFSQLPQRVLWKWESESLPGKPDNVMVDKWLPQQDILAHPNVRAFITQGGLQSFQEAAYHGVPLIGMPFMGDQQHNVRKFLAEGIGVKLQLKDLTKATLMEALDRVLNDSSYRTNMKRFSAMYRRHATSSLETAVWWIEYVLDHGGDHMRSSAIDLAWYQYLLLDLLAFVTFILITCLVTSHFVLKKLLFYHSCKEKSS